MNIITETKGKCKEISQRTANFCKSFGLYKLLARYGAKKARGIAFEGIFEFLMTLVFTGRNFYNAETQYCKDAVYRFLNNAKIHWEKILNMLAVSVIARIRALTSEERLTAIVVDDSPYSRNRSKKVELLSKIHGHVTNKFFMGFRMLTLGFTDGNTFIPFASQLMASAKAENTAATGDGRTLAARRRKNAVKEMPQRLYELLKSARTIRIPAKHVLFDSWFSNPVTMMTIRPSVFSAFPCSRKTGRNEYGGI